MNDRLDQATIARISTRATDEVFSTMLGLAVTASPYYSEADQGGCLEGVMSFIGLTGKYVGTGSLRCSAESACSLASAFLMSDFPAVNEEVLDAVGELTNMIVGSLKNGLEEPLGPMGLGVPTVIHGQKFTARSMSSEKWTVVSFSWDGGTLDVKVYLVPAERNTASHNAHRLEHLASR